MRKMLRLNAVKERTGKCRSSIYADPDFPKPVKIGARAVAWVADEIDAYIDTRIAQRDAA